MHLLVSIDLLLYEGYEALGHLEVATMLLHWWAICSLEPLAVGHRVVVVEVRLHVVLHVVLLKLLRREGESGVLLLIMGGVLLKRRLLLLVPVGRLMLVWRGLFMGWLLGVESLSGGVFLL